MEMKCTFLLPRVIPAALWSSGTQASLNGGSFTISTHISRALYAALWMTQRSCLHCHLHLTKICIRLPWSLEYDDFIHSACVPSWRLGLLKKDNCGQLVIVLSLRFLSSVNLIIVHPGTSLGYWLTTVNRAKNRAQGHNAVHIPSGVLSKMPSTM